MRYLTQDRFFDVSNWEVDQDFGTFPAGARAKDALIAPQKVESECLLPGTRYLLKRSQMRYPDQFWGEIFAYRVGALLGFDTPPTFAAYDRRNGVIGALVQWFYDGTLEHFIPGGDFLQSIINPSFDRRLGEAHNLEDNMHLMRTLTKVGESMRGVDWQNWWLNALAFDALIGNTDRHQENWGLIYSPNFKRLRFAPLFDNGTSLGQDRFPENVRSWNSGRLNQYIANGHSHVRNTRGGERQELFETIRTFLRIWPSPEGVADLQHRLSVGTAELSGCLTDFPGHTPTIPFKYRSLVHTPPIPFRHLSSARIEWIERNLLRRFEILKAVLNEFN